MLEEAPVHLFRAGLILAAFSLMALPAVVEAYECQSSVDETDDSQRVMVTTDPDAAPPKVLIAYVRQGIVAIYAIGGVFVFDDEKLLGEEAYDLNGTRFDKVTIERLSTPGGTAIEAVHMHVDWSYLEEHASTGIDVRIYGEKGDADLFVEPELISAFFSCLEPSM